MKKLFFTLALASMAIPAWGQSPAWSPHDTEVLCGGGAPDIRIKMCTSLIQAGGESGLALVQVYYDRGVAYLQQGLYDQSIADFTKAIELNPHVMYTYIYRGIAYGKKGLYDQAIADYTKAIELHPDPNAYSGRGQAYNAQGFYDRAITDYSKAIALSPNNALAYNNRAWAYHEENQDTQGLSDAEMAVAMAPQRRPPAFSSGAN